MSIIPIISAINTTIAISAANSRRRHAQILENSAKRRQMNEQSNGQLMDLVCGNCNQNIESMNHVCATEDEVDNQ